MGMLGFPRTEARATRVLGTKPGPVGAASALSLRPSLQALSPCPSFVFYLQMSATHGSYRRPVEMKVGIARSFPVHLLLQRDKKINDILTQF